MPRGETTTLTPSEESRFRAWVARNKITDVDDPSSHYDYRGYWKERGDTPVSFGVDHFPDTYKQHGHPTFSIESKYSKGPNDGGRWNGDAFVPPTVMADTLAQKIKAKYPGVYDDLSDTDLEAKVLAKYPGVYDDIPKTSIASTAPPSAAPTAQAQPPQKSAMDMFREAAGMGLPADIQTGVVKGVASTALGLGELAARGAQYIPGIRDIAPKPETIHALRDQYTTPTNTEQQIGKGLEQTAEFFVPSAAISKAKSLVATGMPVLDAMFGAALEGTSAAGVSSAQKGTTEGAAKTAALTAGVNLGTQAGLATAGKVSNWLGERVERALVKPTQADVKNGFQASNIFKYKLGGSLSDTYDKTQAAIQERGQELQKYLNISNQLGRKVNLLNELAGTASDLTQQSAKNFGQNEAIQRAVNKLADDPFFQQIAQNGDVDIATANQIKQAVGELGAWFHDPTGRVMNDDSKAMETVANALYARLKTAIEQQSVGPIKVINQQLSDLLPIRQAIIRRIPVEQRANVLNLGDLIGVSTGSVGLALLNRFLKSGQFANLSVGAGQAMQMGAPAAATAAGRVTAAGATAR